MNNGLMARGTIALRAAVDICASSARIEFNRRGDGSRTTFFRRGNDRRIRGQGLLDLRWRAAIAQAEAVSKPWTLIINAGPKGSGSDAAKTESSFSESSAERTRCERRRSSHLDPMRTCASETWTRLPLDAGDIVLPGRMWQGCRGCNAKLVLAEVVPMTSAQKGKIPMKYMLSWSERPQGSPMEYENAQKRILEVFTQWKAPDNFKIELFVIRVGDWGGYMLLDCAEPLAVHKFCSMLPAFVFEARPVVPVMDAVRVELEAIAWRDGLKRK